MFWRAHVISFSGARRVTNEPRERAFFPLLIGNQMKLRSVMHHLIGLGCALGIGADACAASGEIWASPETVMVSPGPNQFGSTTLTWYTTGVTQAYLTVECEHGLGEIEQKQSGPGDGFHQFDGVTAGSQCTWRIRADSPQGAELDRAVVTGLHPQTATGSLAAEPSRLSIPADQASGAATLRWNTQNVNGGVDLFERCSNGQQHQLPASAINGQILVSVPRGEDCDYELKVAGTGWQLARTTIEGFEAPPPGGVCPMSCYHDASGTIDYRCETVRPTDTLHFEYQFTTSGWWMVQNASGNAADFHCRSEVGNCSSFNAQVRVVDHSGNQICTGSVGSSAGGDTGRTKPIR